MERSSRTVTIQPVNTHLSIEVLLDQDASLSQYYGFEISGGYENNELLFVNLTCGTAHWSSLFGLLSPLSHRDVILQVNGQNVSGMVTSMARRFICQNWARRLPIGMTIVPKNMFSLPANLSQYLGNSKFPAGSFESALQEFIRHHVYKMHDPVTTKTPGLLKDPMQRMYTYIDLQDVKTTIFLEKGHYRGSQYMTVTSPVPAVNIFSSDDLDDYDITDPPLRTASFKKAVGILPKNYKGTVALYDMRLR